MAVMTSTYTQAFRTTCIPTARDRFSDIIPSEYIGREIEITIIPQYEDPEYNEETLEAMQEAMDIMDGKIKTKTYGSFEELEAEIDVEIAAEEGN